jgi:hypothetical protein
MSVHYEYAYDIKAGDVLRFGKGQAARLLEVTARPAVHPDSSHHLAVETLEGATGERRTLALNRSASYVLEGKRA